MAQPKKMEIDLDELLRKVRGKLHRLKGQEIPHFGSPPPQGGGAGRFREALTQSKNIEDGLNLIRRHSRIRTELPRSLDRFPINRIGLLRKLLLKGYELLFRDQRAVNNAIADALVEIRRMAELSSTTLTRVDGMEAILKALETRTNDLRTAALAESAKARGQGQQPVRNLAGNDPHGLDSLLAALAQEHQGGRDHFTEQRLEYLAIIRQVGAGTTKHPVLDVGCGRGDWLEVLKREDLQGRGVDFNRVFVEECATRGLEAENEDAVTYLQGLPGDSLGAVTGFHMIEYLPFERLVLLLDSCVRALRSGGVAIFETHDPKNLLSAWDVSCRDPMRHNLLAAPVLKGLAKMRGLSDVEIRHFHPADRIFDSPDGESHLADQLNARFGGPKAYAIIGYKP
jgi:2-polyprenyl-3-methyl-5-hydroxy-6-metoxy-1,4-benzoquinol methylase